MKPNFALDLSHEGIGLFHRAKGGWTLVGDVALDDPELTGKIEMLRKTAADLSPGGFTAKLIIPESQILFTTLTAPGPDDITREVQIRAGLEGLTPYEVGELVFDWQAEGDEVHVAVLARETLAEAEAFATEHRMNPVSYVARGKRGTFKGEAFFGRTGAASTLLGPAQQVERDKKSVPLMKGAAPVAEAPAPAPEPISEPAPEEALPEVALDEPVRLEDPILAEEPPTEEPQVDLAPFPDLPGEVSDPAPETAPDPVPEPIAAPEPDLALDPFMQVEDPAPAQELEEFENRLADVPDPEPEPEADDALLAPFPPPPAEGDDEPALPPITPVIRDLPEDATPAKGKRASGKGKAKAKRGKQAKAAKASETSAAPTAKAAMDGDAGEPPVSENKASKDTPKEAEITSVPSTVLAEAPEEPAPAFASRRGKPEGAAPAAAEKAPEVSKPVETAAQEVEAKPAKKAEAPTATKPTEKVDVSTDEKRTEVPTDEKPVEEKSAEAPSAKPANARPALGAVDRGAVPKGAPGLSGLKRDAAAPKAPEDKGGHAGKAPKPAPDVPVTADRLPDEPPAKHARTNEVKERGAAIARDAGKSGQALLSSARKGLGKGIAGITGAAGRAGKAAAAARVERKSAKPDAKPDTRPAVASTSAAKTDETGKPSALAAFLASRTKEDAGVGNEAATQPVTPPPAAKSDTAIAPPPKRSEAEAMTVFGARQTGSVGGKPRHLGLALTLLLLLAMAVAAVWSMFSFSDGPQARFDQPDTEFSAEVEPELAPEPEPELPAEDVAVAPEPELAPEPEPTPEELAELAPEEPAVDPAAEAVVEPEPELPLVPELLDREAAEARYAATGIWERAPDGAEAPLGGRISDIYIASIDPEIRGRDPVALPRLGEGQRQGRPALPAAPAPPGTTFDFDERGLVRATPDGALSPDGILVFSGTPEVTTGRRPGTAVPEVTDDGAPELPRIRPTRRPEGLVENNERATLGGLSRDELSAIRPTRRPAALAAVAAATPDAETVDAAVEAAIEGLSEEALAGATSSAVANSPRPDRRPADFDEIVARAEDNSDGSVAVATTASVQPSIPTSASVADQATIDGALNLRRINLIGVYGASNARRALVRLPSGRFIKVSVGDRLDGGRVTSISTNKLIYQKGGRNHTLEVPS
ncbi:hypothetical protein [Aliiroseovarius sp.]|uniref:hypothetical protein n=1 Tax=Aliiroseovarius sp. TaxID=1872442 RepID=UPI003BACAB2E